MEQKIFLTDNGFEFLESYFRRLYGDFGTYEQVIGRYLHSIDFCVTNRVVKKVKDIPIITRADIDQIIQYERKKKEIVSDFIAKYELAKEKEKLTPNNYIYLASMLGVVPIACPDSEPLYSNLLNFDQIPEDKICALQKSVWGKPNIVGSMVDFLYHGFKEGMIIRIPDKGRNVWHQGNRMNYYRGESAYYGRSPASLFRTSDKRNLSREEILIGLVNIADFSLLLRRIPYVSNWPFGDVFYPGIAQHYGMATSLLDITTDFKVALFFACTKWDKDKKKWIPLSNKDFAWNGNRKEIKEAGGDPRWGVIFRAPADINNFCSSNSARSILTPVYPMGYQPFLRCEKQSSYYISASQNYDLYLDRTFEKVRFELSEELCNWIFDEMHQGLDVYPKDISGDCSELIDFIKEKKVYSETALDLFLKEWGKKEDKTELIKSFEEMEYRMNNEFDSEINDVIDRLEKEFVENKGYDFFNQRNHSYRFQFCI